MLKKMLVSAISLLSITSFAIAQNQEPIRMMFKDCEEAFKAASDDIDHHTMKYFLPSAGYHTTPEWELKHLLMDSIMEKSYHVNVIREGFDFSWDYTVRCYTSYIENHLDTTHNHRVYARTFNIVQKMYSETDTIPESLIDR